MSETIPVVIDTNVLVPSLYSITPIARFLLSGDLTFVWNDYIINEAIAVIEKMSPRYESKTAIHSHEVILLLKMLASPYYQTGEMPENWPQFSPDRKDDPFLFAAHAGNALFIISKDKSDMLCFKNYKGIPIGSPREFFCWAKKYHPKTG